jgi:hypothetical protein
VQKWKSYDHSSVFLLNSFGLLFLACRLKIRLEALSSCLGSSCRLVWLSSWKEGSLLTFLLLYLLLTCLVGYGSFLVLRVGGIGVRYCL